MEEYLSLRMKELVPLRQHIIEEPYMYEFERKFVLDGMKLTGDEMEQVYRSADSIYRHQLSRIASICKVMEYKTICFYRHENGICRVNRKPAKEIIKREISYNPYIGYKELVDKDLSLDIETELEYLIESEQLIRRKPNHKNSRYRWEARIK